MLQVETGRVPVPLKLTSFGLTDTGQKRIHNEDAVLLRPDLQLYVLADGAGGHNAGNVASALATTSIANYFESTQAAMAGKPDIDDYGLSIGARRLACALLRANSAIVEIAKTSNKYRGMGTTAVALAAAPETATLQVGHVGDSRCYRLRAGMLEQMTHDHSLLNDVLELRPDIDDADLAKLPRHVVTRALGMGDHVRVSARTIQMMPGDRYLLCSDGLTDMLDDETIGVTLGHGKAPEDVARSLIESANFVGGEDNIATVVVMCEAAVDVPVVRKPRASRPHFTPEMRGSMGSAPEIIVMGAEVISEADLGIHVVPADSATASLMDAFAGLAGKKKK